MKQHLSPGNSAATPPNYAVNAPHSGVTALAQGGKRGAAGRARYRGRQPEPAGDRAMHRVVLTVLLASSPAAVPPHPDPTIDASKATVLGVALQDSEQTVRRLLGVPFSIERSRDEMADAAATKFRYEGIEVYLVDNEVYRLSCSAPRCETVLGIRVGDPVSRVFEKYGPAEVSTINDTRLIRYGINGTDCWLDFRLTDGKVTEIVLWFDYS